MSLNPAQLAAVNVRSGPLLVLAGAGTGKTRVVTFRIAELIRRGVAPSRILAVTFTNKAAAEMQERAAALLGKRPKEKPEISTFHSLCVRILRRHIQHLGYPPQFAIYDRGDQESVVRTALREIRAPQEALRPGDALAIIGRWKSACIRPDEAASHATTDKEHLAAVVYRRYQSALRAAGAVDFDDLLLCTEELFQRVPSARKFEANRLDHLLIDEYQDTNASQYRIVQALALRHRNLCVVGDDDQSIYGWRGADVEHILRFQRDWPDARVIRLEENYRSTAEILTVANRLIGFNRKRHAKTLRPARPGGERPRILQYEDESAEARSVIADIQARLSQPDTQPRDIAILFRTNEQPRPFEQELRKAKLPYVLVGGMSFFDRKEVRDILAYCRVLVQPRDEPSLLRIINLPARGLPPAMTRKLVEHAVARGKSVWEVLPAAAQIPGVSPAAATAAKGFRDLIERHQQRLTDESPLSVVGDLIQRIGYQDELARQYKEPHEQQSRWAAVEEVVNALSGYSREHTQPTLSGFLDEVALGGRDDADDKDRQLARNAIALLTLHAAKGLEFPQVYLVGLEEGLLPHRRAVEAEGAAIDEERRLCYVGVTRAQDRLTLTLALTRMKWGRSRETQPSRFLFEITGDAEKASDQQPSKRHGAGTTSGSSAHPKRRSDARAAGSKNARKRPVRPA